MFCEKCGNTLKDGAKFCSKCGNAVKNISAGPEIKEVSNKEVQNIIKPDNSVEKPAEGKSNKGLMIALSVLIVVLLALIAGVGYFLYSSGEKKSEYNKQIDLAGEYYADEKFSDAIDTYKKAIELIPDREEAYIGLADVYLADGKDESAVKILKTGYKVTQSARIEDKINSISEKNPDLDVSGIEEDGKADGKADDEDARKEEKPVVKNPTPATINIRQVDNTQFPKMTFYATISDKEGKVIENADVTDFKVQEIDANGKVSDVKLTDVYKVISSADDRINMNLVLDASGSMDDYNKMDQAKTAANSFLQKVNLAGGDRVEVISFDDFVYLEQEFVSDFNLLNTSINAIEPWGSTALYDALYAGVFQTYYETGAKCVVGFTDGMENASSYTFEDVVNLAQSTGIPVYIVGIGEEYDADALKRLASECSGAYYSANTTDLASILEDIYLDIYQEQQDYYVFEYTSPNTNDKNLYREIAISTTETSEFAFTGEYRKEYVPVADLWGAFSDSYGNKDYIIPDSSSRTITDADLRGLSLAELRIARNEIFARHGRQFKDSMLNQWFYSKAWYLNIPQKYSPDYYDSNRPSPLSKLETDNVNLIKAYENAIMDNQDIYPNASTSLLSDYDLCLSKAVLKRAYSQMQGYKSSNILTENLQKVQEAINKEDISY